MIVTETPRESTADKPAGEGKKWKRVGISYLLFVLSALLYPVMLAMSFFIAIADGSYDDSVSMHVLEYALLFLLIYPIPWLIAIVISSIFWGRDRVDITKKIAVGTLVLGLIVMLLPILIVVFGEAVLGS